MQQTLESSMQRGDDIVVWSDPVNPDNLSKLLPLDKTTGPTFFNKELDFIKENASKYGYDFDAGITNGTFSN